ncbi:DUF2946 domain-containing protein [Acinetobacter sp. 187]|uniref:DUF2946 domain-containing protein n=1 Tax=Acinetobacter lanii TaxID=2715163 RepID=UPI00140D2777|nr:DUF2946 domain-containing protein [Acinetobacter lanii]NHC04207.1 DUF2946 domain-containing protein [Acinetobacter lanii]
MFLKSGFLLSCIAIALQIAVFLQPLLPKQYQIAPVCETIARALVQEKISILAQKQNLAHSEAVHAGTHGSSVPSLDQPHSVHQTLDHPMHHLMTHQGDAATHDHQDPNHQCQYCKVFAQQVLPPEFDLVMIIDRIQVKLLAIKQATLHIYFALQRLFLTPQGRAPPVLA